MQAFVTGGSGFIGKQLLKKLHENGWQVRALARSESSAQTVAGLGAEVISGDLFDTSALLKGSEGCDVVFHLAGVYSYDLEKQNQLIRVNVHGTENVMKAAVQAGVSRIVYGSSVVVLGDTEGKVVDENHYHRPPWRTQYDRSKWLAHHRVVEPLIHEGAPIIITMPGAVYGPGDHSTVADMIELLYRGMMPILPARDTMISFVHVEDVAEGLILAAGKGKIGESYLLTGENASLKRLAELMETLLNRKLVYVYLPGRVVHPLIPVTGWLARRVHLPEMLHPDSLRAQGATYIASNAKAQRELGWHTRPLKAGLSDVLQSLRQK